MQQLRNSIGTSKRQLKKMSEILDELYRDVTEAARKVKQDQTQSVEVMSNNILADKITKRMIYLNQIKNKKPLMETNARLDELSRILDWLEQ